MGGAGNRRPVLSLWICLLCLVKKNPAFASSALSTLIRKQLNMWTRISAFQKSTQSTRPLQVRHKRYCSHLPGFVQCNAEADTWSRQSSLKMVKDSLGTAPSVGLPFRLDPTTTYNIL